MTFTRLASPDVDRVVPGAAGVPERPPAIHPQAARVELLRGTAAGAWLADAAHVAEWEALRADCPWATVFQGTAFARIWYGVYGPRYDPVLVLGHDGAGHLAGVFALARDRVGGGLVHVGGLHAEYQAWLARPADGGRFIATALERCRAELGATRMRLLFLAPGTPVPPARELAALGIRTSARSFKRGVMAVGPASALHESLRKKSNRSRINRLGRLGAMALRQLESREDLSAVLDRVIEYCDLRQGALHRVTPFLSDPLKRDFYLAMMGEPGLLHATVLECGGEVVASHIGLVDRDAVLLGLVVHSPFLAEHSPGKLLLLLLGRLLGEQGYARFDLTPGDDGYKDRFATTFDEVMALDILLTRATWCQYRLGRRFAGAARIMRIEPARAAAAAATLVRRARRADLRRLPASLARRIWRRLWHTREFRIYRRPRGEAARPETRSPFRVNCIADLLRYRPEAPGDPELHDFLSTALARLEEGQHVYTATEAQRLVFYGWVTPSTDRCGGDLGHPFALPPGSVVLWDDYTLPLARGRGLQQRCLRLRLADLEEQGRGGAIFAGVHADNGPSRHNLEKLGFRHVASEWLAVRAGRSRRWVSGSATGGEFRTALLDSPGRQSGRGQHER